MEGVFTRLTQTVGHIKFVGDEHVVAFTQVFTVEPIGGKAIRTPETEDGFLVERRSAGGGEGGFVPPRIVLIFFSLQNVFTLEKVLGQKACGRKIQLHIARHGAGNAGYAGGGKLVGVGNGMFPLGGKVELPGSV